MVKSRGQADHPVATRRWFPTIGFWKTSPSPGGSGTRWIVPSGSGPGQGRPGGSGVNNRMGVLRQLAAECGGTRPNMRLAFFGLLARMLPYNTCARIRSRLYRLAGIQVGGKVAILGPVRLIGGPDRASRLTIADGAIIAPRVTIALDAPVTIGRKASIGPGVSLYTAGHAIGFGSCRMDPRVVAKPIVVEDGAWVGLQAIILPGVTIGHGSVVSAGAVVGSDVPPNTLVAGNPAVEVGKLPFGNR